MIVTRTEQIWLKPNPLLSDLCHKAKNVYNRANYLVTQLYFKEKKWLRCNTLYHEVKNLESFRALPSSVARAIPRIVDRNWKAFFNAMKEWRKEPGKFQSKPKPPGYKKKNGEYVAVFDSHQSRFRDGWIILPRKVQEFKVKTRLRDVKLKQVRIVPKGIGYMFEIVYNKEIEIAKLPNPLNVAAIDLGVRNLITLANNIGVQPIIIKGGVAKSINQYYNKRRAQLKSKYDKFGLKFTPKRFQKLYMKRSWKFKDLFHKISRRIIDWCLANDIGTLVIGHRKGWKKRVNIGKQNTQNFVDIPFYLLTSQILYKAEEVGIKVIKQEESYTSKCSFLDLEPIQKNKKYKGRRISQGLFRSANGTIINADVNAAYNILRKAIPKAFVDGIEGVGLHPARLTLKG
ncbi:MAG: RNA-guided endonuclease InsQ/TnpB family protein [Candidatus Heimdallarchaeota archaeon]